MNSAIRKLFWAGMAGGAAVCLAHAALRQSRWFSLAGKTAIVTGGSRGLGLVLARQLVERGARVAICARTAADLQVAQADLQRLGGDVLAVTCDVADRSQVDAFIAQVVARFGQIDLLFNVAGIIQVGPLDAMTEDDFRLAMDINCWGPLHTVLAVLPHMRRRGWGRIVNVASIGGKRAVPHMLPYAASKFALVGLSQGLRTELAQDGILVSTVSPGLLRTGSPRNATFKGRHRAEYAWFSIGDSLPLVSMDARRAADQILTACQYGDADVMLANSLNLPIVLQQLAPTWTIELLMLVNRLLPEMGGIGRRAARGYESQSALSPSCLTALGERAAVRNNEMRPRPE